MSLTIRSLNQFIEIFCSKINRYKDFGGKILGMFVSQFIRMVFVLGGVFSCLVRYDMEKKRVLQLSGVLLRSSFAHLGDLSWKE